MISKKEFIEFHKEFRKSKGYDNNARINLENFYDDFAENKKALQEELDGDYVVIKTTPPGATLLSQASAMTIYKDVAAVLPQYFSEYGFNHSIFQDSKIKSHKNISVTKHIIGFCKRKKIATTGIEKVLSKLGETYKNAEKNPPTENIQISVDIRDFMLIGNFGCDPGSCFGEGVFNGDKRFTLATHPTSFVIKRIPGDEPDYSLAAAKLVTLRAFGNKIDKNIYCCNIKGQFGESIVASIFEFFFKKKPKAVTQNQCLKYYGGINYQDYPFFNAFSSDEKNERIDYKDSYYKEYNKVK